VFDLDRSRWWRALRLATDWDTLKAQVRRWQSTARLVWSEAEIVDVARHLNDTIYRYPQTSDRVSLRVPAPQWQGHAALPRSLHLATP
jgi:hypothetical protein